jgi:hypothetical protein
MEKGMSLLERVCRFALELFSACRNHEIVQNWIKPWIARNIEPLDRTDYALMIGGLALGAVILAIGTSVWGLAALPLSICAGGILFGGCFTFSRSRVKSHFDEEAWEKVDQLRRTANDFTQATGEIAQLTGIRKELDKPEFEHRKKDLKWLDGEIVKFEQSFSAPDPGSKKQIVQAHVDVLKPLLQAHPQDLALLEAAETQIKKMGTKDYDAAAVETQKQKLRGMQSAPGRQHLDELVDQISDMLKTASGPSFAEAKKAFLESLKRMQEKLSSRDVEDI